MLGLDASTLRWQIHKGKLKAKRIGPLWVVTLREVDRYRAQHKRS